MDDRAGARHLRCDRCRKPFQTDEEVSLSFFTMDTICETCIDREFDLRKRIRAEGRNPDIYENCGYLPDAS